MVISMTALTSEPYRMNAIIILTTEHLTLQNGNSFPSYISTFKTKHI